MAQSITLTGDATATQLTLQIQIPVSTVAPSGSTTDSVPATYAVQLNQGNLAALNSALQIELQGVCSDSAIAFAAAPSDPTTCPLYAELTSVTADAPNSTTELQTIQYNVTIFQQTPNYVQEALGNSPVSVVVNFSVDGDTVTTPTPAPVIASTLGLRP